LGGITDIKAANSLGGPSHRKRLLRDIAADEDVSGIEAEKIRLKDDRSRSYPFRLRSSAKIPAGGFFAG
jgi:hypothetical protein